MIDPTDYAAILRKEAKRSGVVTVSLRDLRDNLIQADRLGVNVLRNIRDALIDEGFDYFPLEVLQSTSPRQDHEVRLVLRDSDAGRMVRAILDPNEHNDQIIKTFFSAERGDIRKAVDNALKLIGNAEAVLKDAVGVSNF